MARLLATGVIVIGIAVFVIWGLVFLYGDNQVPCAFSPPIPAPGHTFSPDVLERMDRAAKETADGLCPRNPH